MKTNLHISYRLLYYYHRILYGFIYFSMKYLRADNIFLAIFLMSYLLSSTLFIFSAFNELNIMHISLENVKYLEGYDCPMELIDNPHGNEERNEYNIYSKFLSLFTAHAEHPNNINYYLPIELKNIYYMGNKSLPIDIEEYHLSYGEVRYMYKYAIFYQKVQNYEEIMSETIHDLKLIQHSIN